MQSTQLLTIENTLQSNASDYFRSLIIDTCEKEMGNFKWANRYQYFLADPNGNVFFSCHTYWKNKVEFPPGAKCTFLPSVIAQYYNANASLHISAEITDLNGLNEYLASQKIEKISKPAMPHEHDRESLKDELLNCYEFIMYFIVNNCKDLLNSSYEELHNKIFPIIDSHMNNAEKAPLSESYGLTSIPPSLKPGDLLFFSITPSLMRMGQPRYQCVHMGIYYGFNKKNRPLIFDLWKRDGSESAKVVSFSECDDYVKCNFKINAIPLDTLYAELDQQLGLSKAIHERETAKNLSSVNIVCIPENPEKQPGHEKPRDPVKEERSLYDEVDDFQYLDSKFSSLTTQTVIDILVTSHHSKSEQDKRKNPTLTTLGLNFWHNDDKTEGRGRFLTFIIQRILHNGAVNNLFGFHPFSYIHLPDRDKIALALYLCLTATRSQDQFSFKSILIRDVFGFDPPKNKEESASQLAHVKTFLNQKFYFEKMEEKVGEEYELVAKDTTYQIAMLRNLVSFYFLELKALSSVSSSTSSKFIHQIQFILIQNDINDHEKLRHCYNLIASFLVVQSSGRARELLSKFNLDNSINISPSMMNKIREKFTQYPTDYFTPLFDDNSGLQYCLSIVAVLANYKIMLINPSKPSTQLCNNLLTILSNQKISFVERAQQAKEAIQKSPKIGKRLTELLSQSKLIADSREENSLLIDRNESSIQMKILKNQR